MAKRLYNTRIKQLNNGQYMNYLPVSVYTDGGTDCTLNGVTSVTGIKLVVPCEDGHISEEDVAKHGYTKLEAGEKGGRINFVPAGAKGWTMFGGNFVYTCDSRFSRAYGGAPVHVHDRLES